MELRLATPDDLDKLLPALRELRPHRTDDDFRKMIPGMTKEGFRMAFVGDDQMAYAVAGFRIITYLFSGKTLYIDDLVTHSKHRKHGYAGQLLEWLKDYARQNGCEHFSLDSGFQRKDAHRFYLNHSMDIESLHFGMKLSGRSKS